ncbi:hypothetical protein BgiMline_001014, partial [Biomphalaria glabrata]
SSVPRAVAGATRGAIGDLKRESGSASCLEIKGIRGTKFTFLCGNDHGLRHIHQLLAP